MHERSNLPQSAEDLYERIRPIVESVDGTEPQLLVRYWSPGLFKDMRSEAEVIMLMHGHDVSDRYLYGLCCTLAAIKEENGGELPRLLDEQYTFNKIINDSYRSAENISYFMNMEMEFGERFSLTSQIIGILQQDLIDRLSVQQIDLNEGFVPGAKRAIHTVMPLLKS